jgi:cytochrome o ubiquinol oxidase operon protein cyoD
MAEIIVAQHETPPGSMGSYISGFVLSILFTLAAYLLVVHHYLSGWYLIAAILGLAIVQLFVQLVFFLHFGRGSKPRWNIPVFCLMLLFLFIVVIGSLWIMHNLNYRMMSSPEEVNQYIESQGNL